MSSKEAEKISRRRFLKGAAAGAGAVAASYPLVSAASTTAQAAAITGVPEKWDLEADVVVIGNGFAAQASAIEAADAGANVLMIEKADEKNRGGNSRVCGQGFIAPSKAIWEDYFKYLKQATTGQGFPVPDETLRFYIEESSKNIEWFKKLGAEVWDDSKKYGGVICCGNWIPFYPQFPGADAIASEPTWYSVGGKYDGPGSNWYFLEDQIAQRKNIKKMYETPAKRIIQNPVTKEVFGVAAENGGKEIAIKAKRAVVVAAGGWEYNPQMTRDFQGIQSNFSQGSPYNTGESIKMTWAAGADIRNMSARAAPTGLSAGILPGYKASIPVSQTPVKGGTITVGANNKRWRDEYRAAAQGIKNKENAGKELAFNGTGQIIENGVYVRDKHPMPMHIILDKAALASGALFSGGGMSWVGHVEGYEPSKDNSVELKNGWVVEGANIRELATKLNRDPDALEAEVKHWNEMAAAGKDTDHGRTKNLTPVALDGPVYAIQAYPACLNTQGGMTRNIKSQVLDIHGNVIPRLYSAGENGDIWVWLYQCMSNVGGGCYGYGRVAGQNAAKETAWDVKA